MTEEEQRVIERLEDFEDSSLFSINMQEDFRKISRLIQNQQYTIDDYREIMKNKNKQIDLMAPRIYLNEQEREEMRKYIYTSNKPKDFSSFVKQYFEKQAKEV